MSEPGPGISKKDTNKWYDLGLLHSFMTQQHPLLVWVEATGVHSKPDTFEGDAERT